jgi:hypothetical protein
VLQTVHVKSNGGIAPVNYFQRKRIKFINNMIWVYGYIQRVHLMRKFGISETQASLDIEAAQKIFPHLMVYNHQLKCYVHSGIRAPEDPPVPQSLVLMKHKKGSA